MGHCIQLALISVGLLHPVLIRESLVFAANFELIVRMIRILLWWIKLVNVRGDPDGMLLGFGDWDLDTVSAIFQFELFLTIMGLIFIPGVRILYLLKGNWWFLEVYCRISGLNIGVGLISLFLKGFQQFNVDWIFYFGLFVGAFLQFLSEAWSRFRHLAVLGYFYCDRPGWDLAIGGTHYRDQHNLH